LCAGYQRILQTFKQYFQAISSLACFYIFPGNVLFIYVLF